MHTVLHIAGYWLVVSILAVNAYAWFRHAQRRQHAADRNAQLDRIVREFAGRRRGVSFLHNGGALQHDR